MKKSISLKSAIGLMAISVIVGVVLAVAIYTLTVPMSFKLSVAYGLELWDAQDNVITQIDWDGFTEGETKTAFYQLYNVGNTEVQVYWEGTIPSGWTFTIKTSATVWNSGETNLKNIPLGDRIVLEISLTEVSANVGQDYTMDLAFSVPE